MAQSPISYYTISLFPSLSLEVGTLQIHLPIDKEYMHTISDEEWFTR